MPNYDIVQISLFSELERLDLLGASNREQLNSSLQVMSTDDNQPELQDKATQLLKLLTVNKES